MAWEIVHDHDVAFAQFGQENLLDVGLEGETVDWAVDHEWRDEPAQRQGADEGRGFPMSKGNADPQPLAPRGPAIAPRHVCGGPGFIDEDQALGIEIELAFEPFLAPLRDVGAALL